MAEWRWADNVLYFEYSPLTIEYEPHLDAFTIARADIHAHDRRHGLTLSVVVTTREITVEHLPLEEAITQGRQVLERLVEEHRDVVRALSANQTYLFDLSGRRVR